MAKKKRHNDPYSEETVKKKRKFPQSNAILLGLCVFLQVLLILFAILFQPQPQDVIREYGLTVTPMEDGSLEMEYRFVWTALDTEEPLTWVEIGVANPRLNYDPTQVSDNIRRINYVEDGDYTALRLDLNRAYHGGETLEFSFTLRQYDMLCQDANGYFYELVPGWFNATPVEHYTFRWATSKNVESTNSDTKTGSYYIWEGSMDCGTYVKMDVRYRGTAFAGESTVEYRPFDDYGVSNDLRDEKILVIFLVVVAVLLLGLAEMYLVDSFVSYRRGRGFLRGYGHHVHVYGYVNPRYRTERDLHATARGGRGGFSGGGCACACACAGGGRAGCSQKDGYRYKKD
ncbi:MAG: hypothetical protein IJX62_08900 [Clostridia bacterium]|nr:hypothetical protein [Clostridia bacterium]